MGADSPPDVVEQALLLGDLHTIFSLHARLHGAIEAIVAPGRPSLSFALFPARLAAFRAALNARGIGRGDLVVVVAPNSPETALACVALMSCAVVASLNPAYTVEEYHRYLARLRPRALLTGRGQGEAAREAAQALGIMVVEMASDASAPAGAFEIIGGGEAPCRDAGWNGAEDRAVVLHTSGTTAQQKVIPVRLRQLLAGARDMRRTFRLAPGDRTLHVMPMYHGHGLRSGLLQPLVAGTTVICLPRFDPDSFVDQLRDHRATWYSGSYTIHKAVLDQLRARPEQARGVRLRFIRSGSGRLDPAVMHGLEAALGTVVIERYGMSETGTVAVNPLPPGRRKAGSVGLPEGHEIAIFSPIDGTPTPAGAEGEIRIKGPAVFDGYLDDPAATAAAFVDGWFRSGDLGRLDADGYLTVTGRLKEMINRGGEKISPTEVEAALARHPAVRGACAFAIPHPRLGEEVGAAVVRADGAAIDEDDLLALAAETLAEFKMPRRVFFLTALPLGPTRKVDRRAVARQCLAMESAPTDTGVDAAHAELQARLQPLWRGVLRRDSIPVWRDFFLLGGDSLSAAQLVALVARELGVEIPLRAIFREARTLARMAAMIARLGAGAGAIAPMVLVQARPVGARVPLSFVQEQIWLHDQLQSGSTAYSVNRVIRLRGRLDMVGLARALEMIAARHETLRTTVRVVDGAPSQIIHPPGPVALPVIEIQGDTRLSEHIAAELQKPLDLESGPLLTAVLLRAASDDHVLVMRIHHLFVDASAMRVLTRELAAAYRHLVGGGPALPPPPALQFADYALFDRQSEAAGTMARHLDFWRRELDGVREVELPTDRPRPRLMTARGARLFRSFDRVDLARLKLLARAEGSSLFGVLLASVHVLLHRLSGSEDVVLGTPFSRRAQLGFEGVIGPLLNLLPVRADLSGDPSFRAFLKQVTGRVLGIIDHQAAPLTRILDAVGIRRSPDRHPLFQVITVLMPGEMWSLESEEISAEVILADDGSTKFDLATSFVEHADRLELRLQYDTTLFDAATAERIAGRLEALLVAICDAPDARVSMLDILPAAERRLLLDDWSGIRVAPPVSQGIAAAFAEQARARPDALAILSGDRRITYAALDAWSTRLAHRLRRAGVRDEAVVGIAAGRSPALIASQLAVLKAGGAFLPLDPRLPAARLAFMIRDAGAVLVLAEDTALPAMAGLEAPVWSVEATGKDVVAEPTRAVDGDAGPGALAYVMYTSGSTGTPKGVAVMQQGVVRLVRDTGYAWFGPNQRFLQIGSVAFDVSMFEIWGALLNGGCVVQVPGDTPTLQEIARIIVAERVTTCWFTSGLFNQMVDTVLDCLGGVEQVLAGGDVVSVTHARKFRAAHPGVRLINGYGPTEATTFAVSYTVADDADLDPTMPIGRPIANTRAYVLDKLQRLLPIGAIGELCLGGIGIARGYVNQPGLTAERFVPDPFVAGATLYRTGDLVRWRPDGTLQFLGRMDRQVKLRGFRVEPMEIETALQAHAAIARAVVVLRRDAHGEARLVAYFATARDQVPDDAALRAFLRERLPDYMVPAVLVRLAELPLSPQGKVDVNALPAVDVDRTDPSLHVAPRTPFEEELVAIWREVLRVERVGVTDDFFALGGHSLLAVKMLFRVWDVFAIELPLASVFHHPTIEQLALRILERLVASEAAASPAT
jgi:amino acid adenylation domain-containing protein